MKNSIASSRAYSNFVWTIKDVERLLKVYNSSFLTVTAVALREISVIKRATIVMAVTCWETYVEDMLNEEFQQCLQMAKSPVDVQSAFNATADQWLQSHSRNAVKYIKEWTGDAWKPIVLEHFKKAVRGLNSPSSKKIRKLSTRYLNVDVTRFWRWPGVSQEAACRKLDILIERRGDLVHRARDVFQSGQRPTMREAHASLNFVSRLAKCTKNGLGWSDWIECP